MLRAERRGGPVRRAPAPCERQKWLRAIGAGGPAAGTGCLRGPGPSGCAGEGRGQRGEPRPGGARVAAWLGLAGVWDKGAEIPLGKVGRLGEGEPGAPGGCVRCRPCPEMLLGPVGAAFRREKELSSVSWPRARVVVGCCDNRVHFKLVPLVYQSSAIAPRACVSQGPSLLLIA